MLGLVGVFVILEQFWKGGGGIWRRFYSWGQDVRKGYLGILGLRGEVEGGCFIQKEVVKWRCRGFMDVVEIQILVWIWFFFGMVWRGLLVESNGDCFFSFKGFGSV